MTGRAATTPGDGAIFAQRSSVLAIGRCCEQLLGIFREIAERRAEKKIPLITVTARVTPAHPQSVD